METNASNENSPSCHPPILELVAQEAFGNPASSSYSSTSSKGDFHPVSVSSSAEGSTEGSPDGSEVGSKVGSEVGSEVGSDDGSDTLSKST
jgi:hypothetical protein